MGTSSLKELSTFTGALRDDCVNDTIPLTVDPLTGSRIQVAFLEKFGSVYAADKSLFICE